MASSSSSNIKMKSTPNSKTILKENNIYPGINPTTKIANECSSLNFVSVFPQLQQWLTSQNLEQFIKDHNGDKIPFITTANERQLTLADQITIETYESTKAQRLATFRDEFRNRWNQEIYNIHNLLNIKYPLDTLALITNKDLKANAKRFNNLPTNSDLPTETIHFGDPRVDAHILEKFHQSYAHFSEPIAPLYLTNEIRRNRLQLIGQLQQLDKDIESAKLREQTKETTQSENIRLMKIFFTQIITNYPPEITTLVDNREFATAWNRILVYNLEIIDSDNIQLSLQRSILNLEFDINIDKTFLGYYERHLITHALLLFKRWHNYITYDECKNIVDTMTDAQFANKYATFIDHHSLALPDLCTENNRLQILKAAFKGTHLQETLSTFDQLHSNPHLQTVSDLKSALSNKDNCTDNKYGRGKSKSVSHSDICIICKYLKEDLHFMNAVNHPAHEPCPILNLEVWKTYFKKNPVLRSDRNSGSSGRPQSNTPNSRGVKTSSNSSTLHILPDNFDETTKCSHCYRSGQGSGRDSVRRKQDHTNHASDSCPYLKAKQNQRNDGQRYSSPDMQHQGQKPYRSVGYSNNNSNTNYNSNFQGNYGQDNGQDNSQYPQGQQQQFLGNNAFDQYGQNNNNDHDRDRGRDRDRNRDRHSNSNRNHQNSPSPENSRSTRDPSRSRSRDANN